MRNADELKGWEYRLERWALLPSVILDSTSSHPWCQSTNKIMNFLCMKVAECRAYPDGIPSEMLLEELKKAIDENDDMWFRGQFEEHDHPMVAHVGRGIADAIRYERGELRIVRRNMRDEARSIRDEIMNRSRDAWAEGRELIARETKKGSVEDEQ